MALMGLAALFGLQKPIDVGTLPPPANAAPAQQPPDAAALDSTVKSFARGRFEAGAARYFKTNPGTSWQMVVKLLAEQAPLQGRAKRVRFGWERPGLDLVEVFDLGGRKGVVVAMQGDLVGYYPVSFAKGAS